MQVSLAPQVLLSLLHVAAAQVEGAAVQALLEHCVRLVHAHLPDTQLLLAQALPTVQLSAAQVPVFAPEHFSERPQLESCVQLAALQLPGVNVHDSLPHCPSLVH